MATVKQSVVLDPVSNNGKHDIDSTIPYIASVAIEGTAPILFHAWNTEAVEEKGKAAKGSKAKKEDNIESYVYRCDNGNLGIPGSYLRGAIIEAAKYRQDPRSPRKSARDLFKAGVVALTVLADTGAANWDAVERHRVKVQMAAVTRSRPSLFKGWRATFEFSVLTPEYIPPDVLNTVIQEAGRLVGIADFRPTYGRFQVVHWEVTHGAGLAA
jgi:hypothetical protein